MFIAEGAHAVVRTIAQLGKDWAKGIVFPWKIVDEATKLTETQFVQIWSDDTELAMMIGDHAQLGPTVLSKPSQNPFARQLASPPYSRFVENGHPYHMLKEVMRATAGLEVITSDVFYEGRLKPGINTSFEHRPISVKWQNEIRLRYPDLKAEPKICRIRSFLTLRRLLRQSFKGYFADESVQCIRCC